MKELYLFFALFIALLFGAGVLTVIVLYFRSFVRFLWGTSEKCFFLKKKPMKPTEFVMSVVLANIFLFLLLCIVCFVFVFLVSAFGIFNSQPKTFFRIEGGVAICFVLTLGFLVFVLNPIMNFFIESRRMDMNLQNKWVKWGSFFVKILTNASIIVSILYSVISIMFLLLEYFVKSGRFDLLDGLSYVFFIGLQVMEFGSASLLFVAILLAFFPSAPTSQQTKENP